MSIESKNRIKSSFFGRFSPAFIFIFTVLIICLSITFVGNTFAYYTSKLASASDSARVAKWNVSVHASAAPVEIKYNSGWSTPYRVTISNDSEVLASYGNEADEETSAIFSYLTFSNIPREVNSVRIFDPVNGSVRDISGGLVNNSIVIRFTGTLEPGEEKEYFIQFCSDLPVGSDAVAMSKIIGVDAEFHFEQAFKEYAQSVSSVETQSQQ